MKMKVSVTTLGCRSNQYDSSALEDTLRASVFDVVEFPSRADAYIINTCTVTSNTDAQSRQLIRRVRRINPDAVVVVTGCYAQVSPEEIKAIDGVDFIVGNPEKGAIAGLLIKSARTRTATPRTHVGPAEPGTPFTLRASSSSGRTRANLKVQEGCNRSCSYCIIPKARGVSKSLALEEVERDIDSLAGAGYKELVLTGIHLGAYGADLKPARTLIDILKLAGRKPHDMRIRLSSLDPDEVTDELIEAIGSSERVCRHLHLPLQSGDDGIIRRMNRPYTGALFAEKVERAAEAVPGISIGVDVIVGFPGEGDEEFERTFTLLEGLPVSYMHIFPYSKRRGTPAAGYDGQVPGGVIKNRCARLSELDRIKREAFYRSSLGTTARVLVESSADKSSGSAKGRSSNYIPVRIEDADIEPIRNTFVDVRLTGFDTRGMTGVL